jgi:hypothetical protein
MQYIELIKRISGVMVSVQASGEGNRGFKPWSGQTKHSTIGSWSRFPDKIENCVLGNCEIAKVHIV